MCRRRSRRRSGRFSSRRRRTRASRQRSLAKMVEGRLQKYLNEISLTGQPFQQLPDKPPVGKILQAASATVTGILRFEVGEGIEKKQENFAAEVMAQVEAAKDKSEPDKPSWTLESEPRGGVAKWPIRRPPAAADADPAQDQRRSPARRRGLRHRPRRAQASRRRDPRRHGARPAGRGRDRRRQHLPRRGPRARRHGPGHRRPYGNARDRNERARVAGRARVPRRPCARDVGGARAGSLRGLHPPPRGSAPRKGPRA